MKEKLNTQSSSLSTATIAPPTYKSSSSTFPIMSHQQSHSITHMHSAAPITSSSTTSNGISSSNPFSVPSAFSGGSLSLNPFSAQPTATASVGLNSNPFSVTQQSATSSIISSATTEVGGYGANSVSASVETSAAYPFSVPVMATSTAITQPKSSSSTVTSPSLLSSTGALNDNLWTAFPLTLSTSISKYTSSSSPTSTLVVSSTIPSSSLSLHTDNNNYNGNNLFEPVKPIYPSPSQPSFRSGSHIGWSPKIPERTN